MRNLFNAKYNVAHFMVIVENLAELDYWKVNTGDGRAYTSAL